MNKEHCPEDSREGMIIDFLNGRLSPSELEEFKMWLEESPDNLRDFQEYQKIWLGSSQIFPDGSFSPDKGWSRIESEISRKSHRHKYIERHKIRMLYIKAARVAAIFLAVFAFGATVSWLIFSSLYPIPASLTCEVSVPAGSRSRIVLPDSSIVWLNAGSTISYSNDFSRSGRYVKLEGEAHFDVVSNPRKPFIVETSHLNVKATGTTFNIKAYPDDEEILATLVEGELLVEIHGYDERVYNYPLKPNQSFTLVKADMTVLAGQMVEEIFQEIEKPEELQVPDHRYDKPKALVYVKTNIRPELYTSWKDDEWIIEGESLDNMAVMLERRYNTNIRIHSDELKEYRFSGTIMNETLEQVLDILRMTAPVKYAVGKGYVDWNIDQDLKHKFDKVLERKKAGS